MIQVKAGIKVRSDWYGPYTSANIIRVSGNGWCRCKWDDGREFSARAHWLCQYQDYELIPSTI